VTSVPDRTPIPLRNALTSIEVAQDTVRRYFLDLLPQEVPAAIRKLEQASQELLRVGGDEDLLSQQTQSRAKRWADRYAQGQEWAYFSALYTLGVAHEANFGKGNQYEIVSVQYVQHRMFPDDPATLNDTFKQMAYSANPYEFHLSPDPIRVDFAPGLESWADVKSKAIEEFAAALDATYAAAEASDRWKEAQRLTIARDVPPDFTIEDVLLVIRHLIKKPAVTLKQLSIASPPIGGKSQPPSYQWVGQRIDRIAPLLGFTRDQRSE
jgi:hypothetical protein